MFHRQLISVKLVIVDSVVFLEHDFKAEVSLHILVFYKPNNVSDWINFFKVFSSQLSRMTFIETYNNYATFIVDFRECILFTMFQNVSQNPKIYAEVDV